MNIMNIQKYINENPDIAHYIRTNNESSSYSTEALALLMAVNNVPDNSDNSFLIITDSVTCLMQLIDFNERDP